MPSTAGPGQRIDFQRIQIGLAADLSNTSHIGACCIFTTEHTLHRSTESDVDLIFAVRYVKTTTTINVLARSDQTYFELT
jgi:hypothetical protein